MDNKLLEVSCKSEETIVMATSILSSSPHPRGVSKVQRFPYSRPNLIGRTLQTCDEKEIAVSLAFGFSSERISSSELCIEHNAKCYWRNHEHSHHNVVVPTDQLLLQYLLLR
jgi:hypothetical protein